MIEKILFKGQEFLLIESDTIAKEDNYKHGRISYAHIQPNGRIMRFGTEIGTRSDIEVLESDVSVEFSEDALKNLIEDPWI